MGSRLTAYEYLPLSQAGIPTVGLICQSANLCFIWRIRLGLKLDVVYRCANMFFVVRLNLVTVESHCIGILRTICQQQRQSTLLSQPPSRQA